MNSPSLPICPAGRVDATCRRPLFAGLLPGRVAAGAVVAAFTSLSASAQVAPAVSSVFVQVGTVGSTKSASVGLTSDWGRSWSFSAGRLGGYWEGSVAEWSYKNRSGDRAYLTQFALKPVFRFRFGEGAGPWFAEAGIGLTATNRLYETDRKRFSTAFNFGDHLAVGRSFGEDGRHELALRVEHFSNGSIKQPNPGETFGQLRYAYRFR